MSDQSLAKEEVFVLSDSAREAIEHENITMKIRAPRRLKH